MYVVNVNPQYVYVYCLVVCRGVSLGLRNGYRLMQLDEDNKPSPEKDKDDKS